MNLLITLREKLFQTGSWIWRRSLVTKIIGLILIIAIGWFISTKIQSSQTAIQYQTSVAEKGTLIVSISASGQVSNANSGSVGTQASGVVTKIHVKNGQLVKQGDIIAEIELDQTAKQNYSQALSTYHSAKNNLDNAKTSYYTLQAELFTQNKKFTELANNSTYTNPDGSPNTNNRTLPEFIISQAGWLAAEAKYKTQQNVVSQAQLSVNSAWLSYQQTSPVIYAPISGTVTGLSLQEGTVLTSQNTTTGTITSQKVASIKTNAPPTITINLTEIDVPNVKIGNKATITLDAFPGKSYTGQVISIDTVGTVSSGVTTYPTTIKFDTEVPDILSNMSAQANILTQIKNDVVHIPTRAIQTQDGESSVQIMRNNQPERVSVQIGIASDIDTEIVSGVNEGETVVTGTTNASSTASTQTTSPFGAGFGSGAFRSTTGGNQVRVTR